MNTLVKQLTLGFGIEFTGKIDPGTTRKMPTWEIPRVTTVETTYTTTYPTAYYCPCSSGVTFGESLEDLDTLIFDGTAERLSVEVLGSGVCSTAFQVSGTNRVMILNRKGMDKKHLATLAPMRHVPAVKYVGTVYGTPCYESVKYTLGYGVSNDNKLLFSQIMTAFNRWHQTYRRFLEVRRVNRDVARAMIAIYRGYFARGLYPCLDGHAGNYAQDANGDLVLLDIFHTWNSY